MKATGRWRLIITNPTAALAHSSMATPELGGSRGRRWQKTDWICAAVADRPGHDVVGRFDPCGRRDQTREFEGKSAETGYSVRPGLGIDATLPAFASNTKLFADSANTRANLAETHEVRSDKGRAKALYEKPAQPKTANRAGG